MSGIKAVSLFLVSILFAIVIFSLWLRIALRFFRVSRLQSIHQMIGKITDPVMAPLNQWFRMNTNPKNRYDWTAFAVLILVEIVKILVISIISFGAVLPFAYVIIYTLADLIIQPCDFLFYLILIQAILSWVNPTFQHPALDIIRIITRPLLQLGRAIVPDISGFDFSPLIILILLKVITLFIRYSLPLPLL